LARFLNFLVLVKTITLKINILALNQFFLPSHPPAGKKLEAAKRDRILLCAV
jgi:hypothetical protein